MWDENRTSENKIGFLNTRLNDRSEIGHFLLLRMKQEMYRNEIFCYLQFIPKITNELHLTTSKYFISSPSQS